MQVPILSGIFTDEQSNFRNSYPRNLIPVPKESGISKGYLRPSDGIISFGTGPGIGRGGINWNGVCYRVMGTKLVSIAEDATITTIGDVGGSGQVTFDYSFDYLAVVSSGKEYLWDTVTLTQVIDNDLGVVLDLVWVDGYFMTTDGENLIVSELNDPFSINPLKYGASEADPDPVKGLLKIRNEVYAMNRYTMELFKNVGGNGFPFERVTGAQIEKGILGTHTATVLKETVAFLGSGRNEAPAVYIGYNGQTSKISTRDIDQTLLNYTETELSNSLCETRVDQGHEQLLIHLPDQLLVYDLNASSVQQQPVWYNFTSTIKGLGEYKAKNLVWCYDKWLVDDPTSTALGELVNTVSSHYGVEIGWDFGTVVVFNEGNGAIFHEVELVCLTGRSELDDDSTIWTQHSSDGEVWSEELPVSAGLQGEREQRIVWRRQGYMRNWRIQRFRGTSKGHTAIVRLDIALEVLANG